MAEHQGHKTNFLDTGVMFEGKYRIVRELGRGGFGMVYLAYQQKMDRHVAIKVLKSGMGDVHRSAKERFLREVKIISKLRHPNTVTIHDFGESADGVLYMVLEFIEGATVKQILKQQGAQTPQRALAWTGQITRSLAEAHRHGVIHRDLKPANVMVSDLETESDFVKVLDFGIARLLRTDERDLTSVGLPEGERELIGTPRYMSPEQVRGESLGPASDVYSVGLILYEMLVGQPAVQGDTTMALISQQISPQPLRLEGLRALPPHLADLIRTATSKTLQQRFADAEIFSDAVDQTLASIGGPPPGSASARQSGRFNAVDSSARLRGGNQTPGMQPHTGQFGPASQPNTGQSGSFPHGNQQNSSHNPEPQSRPQPQITAWQEPEDQESNPTQLGYPELDHTAGANQRPSSQAGASGPVHRGAQSQASGFQGNRGNRGAQGRASGFQGNSIHEYQEGPDDFGADLPPPPSDSNQFEVPRPSSSSDTSKPQRPAPEETSSLEFVFEFVRIALFGIVATIGLYIAFLVVSTIFGHFLSGSLKLIASLILASAIPLLTALGENSKRERFEVVEKPYDRVVRVFIGTAIFSFGTAVICSLAMSGAVVHELRTFPNWFLSDTQRQTSFGEFNAKVSLGLAQVVEEATSAIGIYEGKSHADSRAKRAPAKPSLVKPPAPTRPSTKARQNARDKQNVEEPQNDGQPPKGPAQGSQPDKGSGSGSGSTKPSGDDEYIRW